MGGYIFLDLRDAWRTLRRSPAAVVTIVATLAIGLGLIGAVFAFYSRLFLRGDAVERPGELFSVERPVRAGANVWVAFTREEYDRLRRETDVFSDALAMVRVTARLGGRPISAALVSGNFFQVVGAQPLLGRSLTPADEHGVSAQRVLVLSHRGWNRLFSRDPTVGTSLILRARGNPEQVRETLSADLTEIDPGLGRIRTLQAIAERSTYVLSVAFVITLLLGGLALTLTLSGLFSVLTYIVERRASEIGVRIALGATPAHVALLMLRQLAWPMGAGLLMGAGLAATVATVLMSTPAASQVGAVVHVFDPVAYGASVVIVVTACLIAAAIPLLRAIRIDPIAVLRTN